MLNPPSSRHAIDLHSLYLLRTMEAADNIPELSHTPLDQRHTKGCGCLFLCSNLHADRRPTPVFFLPHVRGCSRSVTYSTAPRAITGVTSSRRIDVGREPWSEHLARRREYWNVGQMRGRRSGLRRPINTSGPQMRQSAGQSTRHDQPQICPQARPRPRGSW